MPDILDILSQAGRSARDIAMIKAGLLRQNASQNAGPMARGVEEGLIGEGVDMARAGVGALGDAYGAGDGALEKLLAGYTDRMAKARARAAALRAQSPEAFEYGEKLPERLADAAGLIGVAGHVRMPELPRIGPGAAPELAFARAGGSPAARGAATVPESITRAGEPVEYQAVSDWDWPGMAKEHGLDWGQMPELERVSLRDRIAAGLKEELKQDTPKDRKRVWSEFNQAFHEANKASEHEIQKLKVGDLESNRGFGNADPLSPEDYHNIDGRIKIEDGEVIDGNHRLAGLQRWAMEHENPDLAVEVEIGKKAFETAKRHMQPPTVDIATRIAEAMGEPHKRVTLADLRARLSDVDRAELDQALVQMMRDEKLALFPEDNRRAITPEIEHGALDLSGVPQHLAYLRK